MSDNNQQEQIRRLATILAADIVGYSRLMDADEEGTYGALQSALSEVVDPGIAKHQARIVKHTGDGFLAEFPTVLSAVKFAMELQEEMGRRVKNIPKDLRIKFRIGINLGDIIVDNSGDIFGDGVNIAARLETLGIPGGICISGSVYRAVHKKLKVKFEDLGGQKVKNISDKVHAYDVRWPGEGGTPDERAVKATSKRTSMIQMAMAAVAAVALIWFAVWQMGPTDPPGTLIPPKSVVVLPFVVTSPNPDDEFFADGLTEELLNSLAQISDLKVAGRTSSFYFKGKNTPTSEIGAALRVANVLEGSVRRSGNQLRISVQLIKIDDGFQLWSETYNWTGDNIFTIQEEIASEVAKELKVALLGEEAEALRSHGTANAEAQGKYLIASAHLRQGATLWVDPTQNNEHLKTARRLLEEAVALDPDFAEAWSKLVISYYLLGWSGVEDGSGEMLSRPKAIALAGPAAERAVSLAPNLPEAWTAMGLHNQRASVDDPALLEEAELAYEKALSLDPDNVSALEMYAAYNTVRGQFSKATALYDRAAALDPFSRVRLLRAQSMYRTGLINEARAEYFEIARLYPGAPYEGGLAEIEFEEGHFDRGLVWQTNLGSSLQAPYVWLSLGDQEKALEAWALYKLGGGTLAEFAELGDYFFKRDYQGLYEAAHAKKDPIWDINFLIPAIYYLEKWQEMVSMMENWPTDHPISPQSPARVMGTGDARKNEIGAINSGSIGTRAAYYAHALAAIGRREEAEPVWLWALELSENLSGGTPKQVQQKHHIRLLVFASRGEKEAAILELEAMADNGWRWLMSPGNMDRTVYGVGLGWFEDSPILDSIRDDPRFIAVVERVKADNAAMLARLNAGLTLEDLLDPE